MKDFKCDTLSSESYTPSELLDIPSDVAKASVRVIPVTRHHIVVYVFLLWSMYSYCSPMYSYCCLCILIVVYVFLDAATLTEVFLCFFLGCKANARV